MGQVSISKLTGLALEHSGVLAQKLGLMLTPHHGTDFQVFCYRDPTVGPDVCLMLSLYLVYDGTIGFRGALDPSVCHDPGTLYITHGRGHVSAALEGLAVTVQANEHRCQLRIYYSAGSDAVSWGEGGPDNLHI